MNYKRTIRRVTQPFAILTLVTLLPLVAAAPVHADGIWTNQIPIPSARTYHAMAYLGGGQMLLFGGYDDAHDHIGDTWVYDLSDNTWTNQAPAGGPCARDGHAMAYLGGDQVLLFGGLCGLPRNGETWVYDLSDNTWTNQTPAIAPSARWGHALAALGEGRVLLFGGHDGAYDGETWVYDLSDNTWTQRFPGAAPSARNGHAMASLGGDQVLLFGGYDGSRYGDTWVYDLSDNTWTNQAPAAGPSARGDHAMASLGGDQVLLFGGGDASGYDGETWVYDLSANTWTNQSPTTAPSARHSHAVVSLGGDQVFLFGGSTNSGPSGESWMYDLNANTWTNQIPIPSMRYDHAIASLGEDQVLLFGGYDGAYDGETWVYDRGANTWTKQAPVTAPSARYNHAMAYLGGGQVLLFGGYTGSGRNGETWVYDLSTNTWTQKFSTAAPSARDGHAMASLGGGQVLLFGGYTGSGRNGETWVYDLSTNTWTNQAPATAPSARVQHAMASFGGGQVLLFGGNNGSGQTWVYDLSANTWTNQAPATAPSARDGHAMASLGGGQVLLFGGYDGAYDGETWVYDLNANTWMQGFPGAAPSARHNHAMASLGEDQVLLFGGDTGSPNGETWLATGFYNQPPVAGAGPDQAVSTLALVTLDGSGSIDPDGDLPLAYRWMQTGGPTVALSDPTTVTPTFTAPGDPTVLTFTLTVIDSLGLPDPTPDEVVITVSNRPPIADAGPDQMVSRLSLVTLDGSGSADPDGDLPLTFRWAQTGGPQVTLSDPTSAMPTFSAPDDLAVLTFTLTVTDSLGLPAIVPDEVVITITNQPPVADAGPDRSVNRLSLVTLDGSDSSDLDGDLPLAYSWAQTGGPQVTFTPDVSVTTFTAPGDPAVLTFTLTVTDSLGLPDPTPDEVAITVSNQPPVADAGPDQSVSTLALVTLDGGGSADPDGDLPLSYLWTQTGGPQVTFTPDVSVTTFTAPDDPVMLTFSLAITDSLGMPDPTPDEVVITAHNQPPVANAGLDQTASTLSVVTLDGSGSTDPDGDLPLSYFWTQTGGPAVALSDPTAVMPTLTTPSDPAVLTFTLTVTDGLGLPDATPDEVVITVSNRPPVADAGPDQTVNTLVSVILDGSTSTDPDGDLPLTYYWTQIGGLPVALSDPTAITLTFTAPGDPAVLTFALTVTDSLGMPDPTPDEVSITVSNQPPVAGAGPDQSMNTLALVTLDGSGSIDPDGDLPLAYWWTQSGGLPVTLSDPMIVTPTFTAPGDPSVLTFTLTVTDSLGLPDSTLDEVVITVNNQPPVANAGPDQSVNTLALVTLTGSGSADPDGDLPLAYLWAQTGGPAVELSDPTTVTPTFTTPGDPAVLTFTLTVTDSLGLPDPTPDEVVITVDNQPPVADAGLDQTASTLSVVTLDGSGSTDPDGDLPLACRWMQTGGPQVTFSPDVSVTTFTAPGDPAVLTFTLTVTDSLGLCDPTPDEVVITVNNRPPVADAGPDQSVSTLGLVTLDGSGSADPDGDLPLSYFWIQIGGPAVTLSDPTLAMPTFSAPGDLAVLTFTLTVTDNLGLPAIVPDEVVIVVRPYRVYLPLIMRQARFGGGMRGAVVRAVMYPQ